MSGCSSTCFVPMNASTANQISMIGPNSTPIVPVPNRCSANSATRIAIEKGTICAASAGDATCRPDTADTTEIAGVSMPSP